MMILAQLLCVQGCSTPGAGAADVSGTTRDITLTPLDDGSTRVVVLADAAFAYGSIVLRPAIASKLVRAVMPYRQQQAVISGYTDNVGASAYNLTLSRERAQSIANELVLQGFSASRLTVAGYGQEHPRASNETEAGRRSNRRVELLFESLN